MCDVLLNFVLTLLVMICLGIGFTISICKDKSDLGISFFLAPLIGYSIVSIVGMFYINYSLSIGTYRLLTIIIAAISLFLAVFWIVKSNIIKSLTLIDAKTGLIYISLFLASLFLINSFLNPVKGTFLFHRFASDLPAYLASSKHLLEGGNLSNADTHIFVNEILNRAFRWGLPAVVSFVGWLNNTRVENVIFYLPLIVYISGLFASFLLLSKCDRELNDKRKSFFLLPILMVFNVGIIFFLFEGFYPQVISVAAVTMIVTLFFSLRKGIFKGTENYLYIYAILISAALIVNYSEAHIISIFGVGGVLFLDTILKNKQNIKTDLLFLSVVVLSIIFIFPFISKYIVFTLANAKNVGNIGFAMPNSPTPSDWVSITNIFSDTKLYLANDCAAHTVKRGSIYPRVIDIILSCWVIYELISFFLNKSNSDRAYFLVPLIGIIVFFITNFFFTKLLHITHNDYLYNKTITLFLPLVAYIFFSHLYKSKNNLKFSLAIILFSLSLGVFLRDSTTYREAVDLKIVDYFNAHPELSKKYLFLPNERGSRNGVMRGQYRYIDRAEEMILQSLIDIDLLDQWNPTSWQLLPLGIQSKEIIILAKTHYISSNIIDSIPKNNILFKVGEYIAVSTGVQLKSIIKGTTEEQYKKLDQLFLH